MHASSRLNVAVSFIQAPKPSAGPHKQRECLPLMLVLRNRLKYALTGKEVRSIMKERLVSVDGKVRTDSTYPAGFMDVISLAKTDENFRLVRLVGAAWGPCHCARVAGQWGRTA